MHKKTILYRGNLKSCNYNCSYCPFSKHKPLHSELEKDRRNFNRFCDSVEKRVKKLSIGAVFVTPYGEASLHRWYWEGLAHLSGLSEIDQVGMQTNLSFSLGLPERKAGCIGENSMEDCLHLFDDCGGKREKLCIWATFHPEMTDMDTFVLKCHQLARQNIRICAGSVGVPENIDLLRELRKKLSNNIYFWVNKMDGLRRNYSAEEVKAFSEIDPFFEYELRNPNADAKMCQDRCFVEADGNIRTCNISKGRPVNWYHCSENELFLADCSQKRCTCYLAYGGREDFALKNIFGNYSVFRIPKQFQAIFFDLDGTLLEAGNRTGLSEQVCGKLKEMKQICLIFFATSMPEVDVRKRLKGDIELFSGGIFASGAYLYVKGDILTHSGAHAPYGKNKESCFGETFMPYDRNKEPSSEDTFMPYSMNKDARSGDIFMPYGVNEKIRSVETFMPCDRNKDTCSGDIFMLYSKSQIPRSKLTGHQTCSAAELRGIRPSRQSPNIRASAAAWLVARGNKDMVYPVEICNLSEIMQFAAEAKAKIRIYRKRDIVYKVTLLKRHYGVWSNGECSRVEELLKTSNCRFFTERNCLEMIHKKRDKGVAIKELCEWLGISLENVLAVGNDKEDMAMKSICGAYVHKQYQ